MAANKYGFGDPDEVQTESNPQVSTETQNNNPPSVLAPGESFSPDAPTPQQIEPKMQTNIYGFGGVGNEVDTDSTNNNLLGAATGLAASELIRSQVPKDILPLSKKMKAAKELQLAEGKDIVEEGIKAADKNLPKEFEAHQQKGLELQTQRDVLKALHAQQEAAHEKAFLENDFHQNRSSINDYLPPELRIDETPMSGGEKWSKNWENKERPNIGGVPDAAAAFNRNKGQGPISSRLTKMWGPSQVQGPGMPAMSLMDRLAANRQAAEQKQTIEEQRTAATPEAEQKLAEARARAKIQLENAKKARDASYKQLMDIERSLEAHRNTAAPTTPTIDEATAKQQQTNKILERSLEKRYGKNFIEKGLGLMPGSESRFLTPLISGALAPEWAEKTKEAWNKAPNWREGLIDPDVLTYGGATVGALAATLPHRYIRGAGVLAQLPATYFSGKETINGPLPSEAANAVKQRLTVKP
jgi:hypothetical protein